MQLDIGLDLNGKGSDWIKFDNDQSLKLQFAVKELGIEIFDDSDVFDCFFHWMS
jgi:hypothetical protein